MLSLLATTPNPDTVVTYVDAVSSADFPFLKSVLRGLLGRDVTDQLPAITVPTLVVRGDQDAARTEEHVRILRDGIPDCTSVEIAGAGHSPMVDTPKAFESALRAFLESSSVE